MEIAESAETLPSKWNCFALFICVMLSVVFQTVFLNCLCAAGTVKMSIAMAIDGLILLRVLYAWLTKERGRAWLFYAAIPFVIIPLMMFIEYMAA